MKKFMALLLVAGMTLSLTACGGSTDTAKTDQADGKDTFTVGFDQDFPPFGYAFRVQRFRLGLLFEQIHAGEWQIFSLLEWRQAGGFFIPARFRLAEHGTPPGFFHHRPFHREVGISP